MGCPFANLRGALVECDGLRNLPVHDSLSRRALMMRIGDVERAQKRADRAARNIAHALAVVGAMRFGMEIQDAVDTVNVPEFAEELRALVRGEIAKRQKPGECR